MFTKSLHIIRDSDKLCCITHRRVDCLKHEGISCRLICGSATSLMFAILFGIYLIEIAVCIYLNMGFRNTLGHTIGLYLNFSHMLHFAGISIIWVADYLYGSSFIWEKESWFNNTWCKLSSIATAMSYHLVLYVTLAYSFIQLMATKYALQRYKIKSKQLFFFAFLIFTSEALLASVPLFAPSLRAQNHMCLQFPTSSKSKEIGSFNAILFIYGVVF